MKAVLLNRKINYVFSHPLDDPSVVSNDLVSHDVKMIIHACLLFFIFQLNFRFPISCTAKSGVLFPVFSLIANKRQCRLDGLSSRFQSQESRIHGPGYSRDVVQPQKKEGVPYDLQVTF